MTVLSSAIIAVYVCMPNVTQNGISVTLWSKISVCNEFKFYSSAATHIGTWLRLDHPHRDESPYDTATADVCANYHRDDSNINFMNLARTVMNCHCMCRFRTERMKRK